MGGSAHFLASWRSTPTRLFLCIQWQAYRTSEAVDISVTGNQEGFNVGWIRAGEFLRYTVYVEKSGG